MKNPMGARTPPADPASPRHPRRREPGAWCQYAESIGLRAQEPRTVARMLYAHLLTDSPPMEVERLNAICDRLRALSR